MTDWYTIGCALAAALLALVWVVYDYCFAL